MSQRVQIGGEVYEAEVYRDMLFRNEVADPKQGDIGYMRRATGGAMMTYDGKQKVWKIADERDKHQFAVKKLPLMVLCRDK